MTVPHPTPPPRPAPGRAGRSFLAALPNERREFLAAVEGIDGKDDRQHFASALLGRLMFLYFVQRRGLLGGDSDYLGNRLARHGTFYRAFLRPILHEEFGPHGLERACPGIDIPDEAFRRLFAFFNRYGWILGGRAAGDNEVGPDVIGCAFERHIPRRATGAYYTGEDVSEYIARGTIVPFLLDAVAAACPAAFRPDGAVWGLLREDPDRYLFGAVRHGAERDLPATVAAGLDDVARRGQWNRPAADGFGLPTETWREHVARRRHCHELRRGLRGGAVCAVNDLVTENLDVRRFAADVIGICADPALLRAFWAALRRLSVLDPTCGAGAFLLAALNVLEPLHDACLGRMEELLQEGRRPAEVADFAATLEAVKECPSRRYFVLKSIIGNNLHGLDLMSEAAEVCRLRLRLRVIAEARTASHLEGLADIGCNVRAGNALVGCATRDEAERNAHEVDGEPSRAFHWFGEFSEVMARGGFDVIIGNPPYVEYAGVRKDYRVRGFATERCGNLYAFVMERNAALLRPNGRSGMIVPHSAFCTDRMAPLLDLFRGERATWVSTYDIRPAKLFAGVDQRLAIYLIGPSPRPQAYSTRYHRWHEPARPALFHTLRYADVSHIEYPNSVAKAECETELRLWEKLRPRQPLAKDLVGPAAVYYHNAPRYWVRAMTFAPYFRNERDGEKPSAQVKRLRARDRREAAVIAAALNSTLFYWWFILFSDSRHLNLREIERFPLGVADMGADDRRRLAVLCERLMENYRRHAVRKECRYRTTGRVVYDEYYPRHSKGIIDEIDRVLARHYGFSDEQLDFIINYDIKYRINAGRVFQVAPGDAAGDPLLVPRLGGDHADDVSRGVEHRPARVARVDRDAELVVVQVVQPRLGAQDAAADGVLQQHVAAGARVADHGDVVAVRQPRTKATGSPRRRPGSARKE